jgi:hypothetical protein
MPTSDRRDAMDAKSENREWRIEDRHAIFDSQPSNLNLGVLEVDIFCFK